MTPSLFQLVCCPLCGGTFSCNGSDQIQDQVQYGILSCYCSQYPIVDGIPILKKGIVGSMGQTTDNVIKLLEERKNREALLTMLLPPPPPSVMQAPSNVQALANWQKRAEAHLTLPESQLTFSELTDSYFNQSGVNEGIKINNGYYYMVFRFATPRHLVPLALATIIQKPNKPVIEIGCGCGHITRSLIPRALELPVIGLDRAYFMLYAAKNRIAPLAQYVCADADVGLPFRDGTFSIAFSSDAFHLFADKSTCFRELQRLTQDDGCIILSSLRNALIDGHLYPGTLPVDGYEFLARNIPHVIIRNTDILGRYLRKEGPQLSRSADREKLVTEPFISMVATHRPDVLRDYGLFEEWPHALESLQLNPLYVKEKTDRENVHFRRVFPSSWYQRENDESRYPQYLPETICVNESVLKDLELGRRTADVETLLDQCVVVGMPNHYIPATFSHTTEHPFEAIEEIGGSFYIEKIRISDLIAALIPEGNAFILVDDNKWGIEKFIASRRVIPFLERGGEYWGLPQDDETAISELERLRASGVGFIVFGWPALWWLDYYGELRRHLYTNSRCILQNDKLVAFDLQA